MAGFGNFLAGAFDYKLKQDEKQQDMAMYEKKLKLANDLALQLEERKRQLAQQYPTYSKFVTTATGDVIGLTNMGDQKRVYEADPDTRKMMMDYKQAMANRANAQAERAPAQIAVDEARAGLLGAQAGEIPSKIGLNTARTNLLTAKTENPGAFGTGGPRDQLTANATLDGYNQFRKLNGTIDPINGKVTPLPDTQETYDAYKESLKRLNLRGPQPTSSLLAPQADPMDEDYMDSIRQAMGDYNPFVE